ncbi:protein LURP-one-related 15-like [Impatiens glandulifera]|uniref:protein LURP-one-related 15-like n=1 Tax=Impatiens glandulifera TaxID=253017 RepID=UPI001FB1063D|nr:protein LURP-one-related 15-like [Impatiens glandulifera]
MAQPINPVPAPSPSYTAITSPIAVIGTQYCVSEYPVDLIIERKARALTTGNFSVTDLKQNLMFKIQVQWSLHDNRILRDPMGKPIVTLRQKIRTIHGRWEVFRGDSHHERDLLFTAKTTSWLQWKTKMDIFLVNNYSEEYPDFRLEGSYSEKSGIIYYGNGHSQAILAQMHKKDTVKSVLLGKDNFRVTVYPNVDYAFIVSLIAILDDIDMSNSLIN